MGEIITLQIGSYSNFIGAHFWNIQHEQSSRDAFLQQKQQEGDESILTSGINSTVLWSEHNRQQTVYRPRLVAVDLEGSLGGLHKDLLTDEDSVCWSGNVSKIDPHGYNTINKHPFIRRLENDVTPVKDEFNFKSTVKYFTDFFIPEWDPSLHMSTVPNYFYDVNRFDSFVEGKELARSEYSGTFWDSLTTHCRNQLELSDHVGAIHVLVDWCSGFGGIASSLIEWMVEEAPKIPVVVYANQEYEEIMNESSIEWTGFYRRVGGCLFVKTCLDELSHHERNSVVLSDFNLIKNRNSNKPISSVAQFDFKSRYESSALPALALDSMSLPYRIEGCSSHSASELLGSINLHNRNLPFISAHLGCPVNPGLIERQTTETSYKQLSSLIDRLWDTSMGVQFESTIIDNNDQSILSHYSIGRGLTNEQEILTQIYNKDRSMFHPDPITIPISFPNLGTQLVDLSSIIIMKSVTRPSSSQVLVKIYDSLNRVIKLGRSASLEKIEGATLLDLSSQLTDMFHSDDSPLDID